MNIYVGNLNYEVQEDDLKQIFGEYGVVKSAKIIMDKETGESKGFGFVEMANETEAKNAIQELNGAELMNRELKVNEAKPKKTFNQRGGGGGFNKGGGNRPNRNFNRNSDNRDRGERKRTM